MKQFDQISNDICLAAGGDAPQASNTSTERDAAETIGQSIESFDSQLWEINQKIHSNPELGFEEVKAHDNITALLESLDFKVTRHAYGLSTSFMAEYGTGGRVVAINAEYDALPDIGHACGHNLIATAGIGAFLGLSSVLKISLQPGRVRLIGTPAEEGGGGKLELIKNGAYKDVDGCMMVHPRPSGKFKGYTGEAYAPTLANHKFQVTYLGKEAHAAMAPWQGLNALDAVVLAYNSISALRQQIKPYERIHGVITQGGTRPNVITAHASTSWYVRSRTLAEADILKARALRCFEGAALATGCEWVHKDQNTYADLRPNVPLCSEYASAMASYGSPVLFDTSQPASGGSTDMGDVTYACPGFQAIFGITADTGDYNHTKGFTRAAEAHGAHIAAVATAKGMALTGWKFLSDDKLAADVRRDFEEDKKRRESPPEDERPAPGCC